MAIAALAASIFAGVGPIDCLIRGLVAFAIGVVATQCWYVFFTIRVQRGEAGLTEKEGTGAVRATGQPES
ncbi:MAG: hypothetical protein JNJ45_00255 [Chthonomonas sp.]|nr:hypothetical protein [Chthonomonas sp.]